MGRSKLISAVFNFPGSVIEPQDERAVCVDCGGYQEPERVNHRGECYQCWDSRTNSGLDARSTEDEKFTGEGYTNG